MIAAPGVECDMAVWTNAAEEESDASQVPDPPFITGAPVIYPE
jgi:hypothetical protein